AINALYTLRLRSWTLFAAAVLGIALALSIALLCLSTTLLIFLCAGAALALTLLGGGLILLTHLYPIKLPDPAELSVKLSEHKSCARFLNDRLAIDYEWKPQINVDESIVSSEQFDAVKKAKFDIKTEKKKLVDKDEKTRSYIKSLIE